MYTAVYVGFTAIRLWSAIPAQFWQTSGSGESISKSGFYFNTVITVTLYGTKDETLLDDCFSLADTYENYFSNTIADSDVSKINAAGGAPVTVHEETAELIKKVFIMEI